MKKNRLYALVAIIVLTIVFSCQAQAAGNTPPDFTVTDISGTKLTLSDLKGKVVLLDFWATWCPPCRVEVPNLVDLHKRFRNRGFVLISVSLDRDLEAAHRFVREKEMSWVHVIDSQAARELAKKYQIEYIPSTFVIDSQGKIAAMQLRGSELMSKIAELLK